MYLIRIGAPGEERPYVRLDDDLLVDVSDLSPDFDGAFFAGGGLGRLRDAVPERAARGATERLNGRRVEAPITRPHQVLCVGLNYSDHAAESGMPVPDEPILFNKAPNTVVGPYDDV